jgi:acyl carrier protein
MNITTQGDIRLFVTSFIQKRLLAAGHQPPNDLSDGCDLLLSGFIDSLGVLELTNAIQHYCGREIDFEALDIEQMTIVGPLCKFVSDSLATGPSAQRSCDNRKSGWQNETWRRT